MAISELEQAAGPLAPARRTNYFDPADSDSIFARYANSAVGLEDSANLAKAASGLADSRMERAENAFRLRRNDRAVTEWDRDDAAYQEKQDYKTQRGEFLSQLSQLNPEADDYDKVRSELYATLPMEAQKDDAVRDIVAAKDRIAQTRAAVREKELLRKEVLNERRAKQEQDAAVRFASMGLKPDQFLRDPQTGELDLIGTAARAAELKKAETEAKGAVKSAAEAEKDARKAMELNLADQVAFPTQTAVYLESQSKDSKGKPKPAKVLENLEKVDPVAYNKAKEYDKDQYASEVNSARNMSEEEYVNKVRGLTDLTRAKREALWRHANQKETAPTASAQPAQAAPATTAPKIIPTVGKRYRMADGSIKTFTANGWQ